MDNNGNHPIECSADRLTDALIAYNIVFSLTIERTTGPLTKLIQRVDRPKCLIVGHYLAYNSR